MAQSKTVQKPLDKIDQTIRKDFESKKRILSFGEYLELLAENPSRQLRGAGQVVLDMMEHFGRTESKSESRFKVFDQNFEGAERKVVGQTYAQMQIYRSLKTFARIGTNHKVVLLHGPNGSAKSSIARALMRGLEIYSQQEQGAMYSFNWIFPLDKVHKGGIGLSSTYSSKVDPLQSYARLEDSEIQSRLPCDLRDHPFLLIPKTHRKTFLAETVGEEWVKSHWDSLPHYLKNGDLCPRCKEVFEALLATQGGEYQKVLMHVQVERFFYSSRYRKGLVTIEPQLHVDAQFHQLTMNKNIGSLPTSLHGLNLFSLTGDLVDGNRGLIDYSDLLKRPMDSFKYLLFACETGSIAVGPAIAQFDVVFIASTNEIQLDAFKEFPDFTSFKARFELVRVPYLLSVTDEKEIYEPDLAPLAESKHTAPHTAWAAALWAVLTRLKKPNAAHYPNGIGQVIGNLTPLDKARLYDTGEMPNGLSAEERKLLRASIPQLKEEYQSIPYYEGRMGASAREMKSILAAAAQDPLHKCLSPLSIFRELEIFCKRVTEYEFLNQDVKDGYHDATEFIQIVTKEYLDHVDHEVRESIGIYDSKQWQDFLKRYVLHVSLVLKKEKLKNPITGKSEDPDLALIAELEKIVGAPTDESAREAFRQNIISTIGAWSLDHLGETVDYAQVFPEFWHKLEQHYFESQKGLLTKMGNALAVYDQGAVNNEEGAKLAQTTLGNMVGKFGYCADCAKEVVGFLLQRRY